MDKRAVDRALRQVERGLTADPVALRGDDGRELRMRPGAALDLMLAAMGGPAMAREAVAALPPGVADWIAVRAQPGASDVERLIVRAVRAAREEEDEK